MYGQPLDPKRTAFTFYGDCWDDKLTETNFSIYLTDLDDPSNDDVRDVDHPDFDTYWGNAMENVFEPNDPYIGEALDTQTKARQWLLSIGMIEHQP